MIRVALAILLALVCAPAHADPITAIVLIAQGVAAVGGIAAIGLTAAMATFIAIGASVVGGIMARRKASRAAAAARNASREALQERTLVLSSSEPSPQIIYGRTTVGGAVIDRVSTPKSILSDGGDVKLKPDALQHVVIALACHQITDVHRVHMFGEWHTWAAGTQQVGGTYIKTGAAHVTVALTFDGAGNASIPGLPAWITVSKVLSITKTDLAGETVALTGWTHNGASVSGGPSSTTWDVTYEATSNEPSLRVEWHSGLDNQPASAYLMGMAPGRWTSAHQLRGVAYVVLTLDLDDPRFQNGLPQDLAFDVSGKLVLDPRTGITAFSDNTALCIYDWLRSPWGYGLTAADIDTAAVIAAANACDALVPHPTTSTPGATAKFSRCAGSFKASDDRGSVLADMAENMGGFTVPGAVWTMHAGTWSAPVLSVGDSHFSGPVQIVRSSTPHDEAFNSARAVIIPEGKRDTQDVDPYQNAVFVADDGGAQWQTFTLPFCPSRTQARNLLRQFVEQARAGMVITFSGDMRLWSIQSGDRLQITSSEYAWTNKTFRVLDAAWAPGTNPQITAQEDIAASYDSADATDADPAPNTGLPNPGTVDTPVLSPAASGNAELIRHADGTVLPRVLVSWQLPVTPYMQGAGARTDVSWRRVTDDAWIDTRVPAGDTQTYLSGMREGDVITIVVRHINSAGFESRWVSQSHQVVGKTAPPSNVTALTITDTPSGLRRYTVAHIQDLDHLGYEIRYDANPAATFAQMASIAARWDGAARTFDNGQPAAGTWRFAACAVDTSGNYSATPVYVTATLSSAAESTAGDSLVNVGYFRVGMSHTWTTPIVAISPAGSVPWPAALACITRDNFEAGNSFDVRGGELFYCSADLTAWQLPVGYRMRIGVAVKNASGAYVGFHHAAEIIGGTGWTRVSGSVAVHANAVTGTPWIQIDDANGGSAAPYPQSWASNISISRAESGATRGAPVGTLVGSTLAQTVESNAATALQGVTDINADGKWSPVEKAALVVAWNELSGSRAGLVAQANAYGIVSERDAFTTAEAALASYLVSLSPPWNDTSTTTTIVRATADQRWTDAHNTRNALRIKIDDEAGKRAIWNAVTGAGRPEDNATVGAAFGVNIGGQMTEATAPAYAAANTFTESIGLRLASSVQQGSASPQISASAPSGCYVISVGGITIPDQPSSSNAPGAAIVRLIVNGFTAAQSVTFLGKSGSVGQSTFNYAISWYGAGFGVVLAHIDIILPSGTSQSFINSGSTIAILSMKR